jgi:hypothetical protein
VVQRNVFNVFSFMVVAGLLVSVCASAALILYYGLITKVHVSHIIVYARRDLILHTLAFTCLALPAFLLFTSKMRVVMWCLAFGVALELAQLGSFDREASMTDVGADAVGIGLAALIFWWLSRWSVNSTATSQTGTKVPALMASASRIRVWR